MWKTIIGVFIILFLCVASLYGDGFGTDIPRNASCTSSSTDGTQATCQFDTTNASDSEIQLIDSFGNNTKLYHDPTMCTVIAGVCHHTININQLFPASTFKFFASACTHAHYSPTTDCPRASPDMSSMGPVQLISQNNQQRFTTIANPGGVLSAWYAYTQAPQNVFPSQAFVIDTQSGIGVGGITTTTSSTLVRYVFLHDVSIDTPSGTINCGTMTTGLTPNYRKLGDSTGIVPCQGGSAATDFIVTLINNPTWIKNSSSMGLSFGYSATLGGGGGYFINNWAGALERIFVKVGSSVAPGTYTIHYHLQPLFGDGTGNQSGQALVSQDKTLNVTFNVLSITPLANHPPASFPAWSFMGEQLAMSTYWGTFDCTNLTETSYRPWAQAQYSGGFLNVPFTWTSWGEILEWNYDGSRYNLSMGDLLFNTTHPDWASGHTYAIGDLITRSGTTYIMNAVGGASSPGLSGTSGSSPPAVFNSAPAAVTADGTLQWMSVGNTAYWQSCAILGNNDGYRNVVLENQATNNFEPGMFPTGILMHALRTGDASAGDETGFSYTESNQHFGGITGLTSVDNSCLGLTATGTSTYATGLDKLALCYGSSAKAMWGTAGVTENQLYQMRIKGLQLQQQDAYWMLLNDPTWITTDDGLRTQRMVDTSLSLLDMFATIPFESITANACGGASGCDSTGTNSLMANFYQSGQVAEGLLHYYQATVYYSNSTLFPGTTVTSDERIPIALKRYADSIWLQFWDRVYDENQSAADACAVRYPTICQATPRRIHSYSFPYNIQGLSDIKVRFEFYNIAGSNGEVGWVYAWLWARDSTMTIPDNGRNSPVITSYADAAKLIFAHAWDGSNCVTSSTTAPGSCSSWNIADFYNGGRTTGVGFPYQLVGPKGIHQTTVNTNSEGLNWLTGAYTWQQGAMVRSTNPCWIVANRASDGFCNAPSPYADVQPPYPIMVGKNGSNPYNNDPAICLPGTIGNATNSGCRLSQALGTNKVPLNMAISPGTLTGNQAIFNFLTVKNATCSVTVGTTAVEPSHVVGVNTFNEQPAHTPQLAGGTPLPLWFHSITATGLTVSTLYHFGLYCTDANSNTYNFPYQLGGATNPPKIAVTTQEQAKTFTTLASGLQIVSSALPDGLQSSSYSATLGGFGGTTPYTWSVLSGSLPAGLALNGSTGVIAGSPTSSGTTSFTLKLTDATSTSVNLATSILVQPATPTLGISNSSFPDGQTGIAYSQNLVGLGGTPPYTWSIAPASIGGLTLDPIGGIIGGTPSTAGGFPFTLTITDSTSATASTSYSISIAPSTAGVQLGKKAAMKGTSAQ